MQLWTTSLILLGLGSLVQPEDPDEESEGLFSLDSINTFRQSNFIQNIEHMISHLGLNWRGTLEKAQTEELEFHFFKMHDLNDDAKLDGLEILAALRHGAHEHYDHLLARNLPQPEQKQKIDQLNNRLAHTVDIILEEDDLDDDGYLTYAEYVQARRANVALQRANAGDKDVDIHMKTTGP